MDALILAGGREKTFAQDLKTDAAYTIDGRSMLDHVVGALAATRRFQRILVVGSHESLNPSTRKLVTAFIEPETTMPQNLRAGLKALGSSEPVLIAASDIPLLSPEAVDEFILQCEAKPGADIYYPIIPEKVFSGASSSINRTYLRLKDGVFTGGNMLLARPQMLVGHMNQVERIIELRKKPLKWGTLIGWGFFIKASTIGVSLAEIETKLADRFKIKGVAVRCESLGIGLDADSEEDLGWIRFYWGLEKKNAYSDEVRKTISVLETVQTRLERGEIGGAEIKISIRPDKTFDILTETTPVD